MTSTYWIKLYTEILHDPKMARLPDNLWRRVTELFLLAGETGADGDLPHTADMAWTLRLEEPVLLAELHQLAAIGIVSELEPGYWLVNKFAERQSPSPVQRRVAEHRARKAQYSGNEPLHDVTRAISPETDTDTDTESDIESIAAPQFVVFAEEPSTLEEMQVCAETLTGCPAQTQSDLQTLTEWLKNRITADDIRGALDWRRRQELAPVKTVSQLERGVLTERKKRLQSQNARGGGKPTDYTAMLPPEREVEYSPPPKLTEADVIYLAILEAADVDAMPPAIAQELRAVEPEYNNGILTLFTERRDYLASRAGAMLSRAAVGVQPGLTLEWSAP